jgi:hypothetical protein
MSDESRLASLPAQQLVAEVPVVDGARRVRFAFTEQAAVPLWMRAVFDGLLEGCRTPGGLPRRVGYVTAGLDWPQLIRDHQAQGLRADLPYTDLTWEDIETALALLEEAGGTPTLVVGVDLVTSQGQVTAAVVTVCAVLPDDPAEGVFTEELDPDLVEAVESVLGAQEFAYPAEHNEPLDCFGEMGDFRRHSWSWALLEPPPWEDDEIGQHWHW